MGEGPETAVAVGKSLREHEGAVAGTPPERDRRVPAVADGFDHAVIEAE